MPKVCWYFQLHQPYRLADFSVFDLNNHHDYFTDGTDENKKIFQKVAAKSYLPMLELLLRLVKKHPTFCFAISCSGIFLEQAEKYQPKVLVLLQQLAATKQVEFLAETYYHSLAALYSPKEFRRQVYLHLQKMHQLFGKKPTVFRNTELIYTNQIASQVAAMRFKGMLTEAVPRYLKGRPKTQLYQNLSGKLTLLLKHAELSDDIAFRFSDQHWSEHPLSVARYLEWLAAYAPDELVNLFMDFETFGEHQWKETGIFDFFEQLVVDFIKLPENTFVTPAQVVASEPLEPLPIYDVPKPISWADVDRDITAWVDNQFQQDMIQRMYALEKKILRSKNLELLEDWRKLQTSDHFYYMCTKWSADGDVHAYFSPYDSPFEAYRRLAIVVSDLEQRTKQLLPLVKKVS